MSDTKNVDEILDENLEDEWVTKRRDETLSVLSELFDTLESIRSLPADRNEALKIVAVKDLDELLPVASQLAPEELSRDQVYAAMLMGRGLTAQEAAEALALPNGEALIHTWKAGNKLFKRVMNYWRRHTMEEQFGLALRELDQVAAETHNDALRLKVARMRYEISQQPEDRDLEKYNLWLKTREVEAREREVDSNQPRPRPAWLDNIQNVPGEVFEADFEIEPPQEDD